MAGEADIAAMAIGGGAPILAGLIGKALAAGDYEKAEQLRAQAAAMYGDDILPQLEQMTAEQQGGSEFGGIVEDPRLRQAQLRALAKLEESIDTGGMTAEDREGYAQAELESGAYERGSRGALEQRMAARGLHGSGIEAAQALSGQQAGVARKSAADLSTAAEARRRAMGALEQYGTLAGGIRGQDYRVSADRAAAQDAINRFNTGQRAEAQGYNLQLPQQGYENRMDLYGRREAAQGRQAGGYERAGGRTEQEWAGYGKGVSDAALGYGQSRKKKGDAP